MGIKDWFKKKDETLDMTEDGYVSLDMTQSSSASSPSSKLKVKFFKFAEQQNGAEVIDTVKKKDAILLVNISKMRNDMNTLKDWTAKVKEACKETHGDVIGLSKDLLLITPSSVEIDRSSVQKLQV